MALAERRHHELKKKRRVLREIVLRDERRLSWLREKPNFTGTAARRRGDTPAITAAKVAKAPKMCSCWMCGNRRKHEGPSISERRMSYVED